MTNSNDSNNLPATSKTQLPDAAGRIADLLNGVANIRNTIAEAGGVNSGLPFIGINNKGVWAYGQDRIEVEPGSLWAIDTRSLQHGYVAWPDQKAKDRKPLHTAMVPASLPLPELTKLPDVGQPYQVQFSFEVLCITGEDAGVVALYKNGSDGCKEAIQNLVNRLPIQAKADASKLCPVVELGISTYTNQTWKKDIHKPVFQIHRWVSFEDYDSFDKVALDGAEAQTEELSAPTPKPEPAPEPEVAARGTGRRPEPVQPQPQPVPRRPGRRPQPAA